MILIFVSYGNSQPVPSIGFFYGHGRYVLSKDQSGWSFFSEKENIDFRKNLISKTNLFSFIILSINIDKKDLTQLEQELGLYKLGEKQGLSPSDIQAAGKAIDFHWVGIKNLEDQIRSIGFGDTAQAAEYLDGVWELYQADHDIMLRLVDKIDISFVNTGQAVEISDGVWKVYQVDVVDKIDKEFVKQIV